jgi:hypothetical protein
MTRHDVLVVRSYRHRSHRARPSWLRYSVVMPISWPSPRGTFTTIVKPSVWST